MVVVKGGGTTYQIGSGKELAWENVPSWFKESVEEDYTSEGGGSYILQMREFGECVLAGTQPETGGDEALRALAVIEAMEQSVENHSVVEVNDILSKAQR